MVPSYGPSAPNPAAVPIAAKSGKQHGAAMAASNTPTEPMRSRRGRPGFTINCNPWMANPSIRRSAASFADSFFQSLDAVWSDVLARCLKQFVGHLFVGHPALNKSTLEGVCETRLQELPFVLRERLGHVDSVEQSSTHAFRFFTAEFVDLPSAGPLRTTVNVF